MDQCDRIRIDMNTPLKFDHDKRPSFQFDRSDYRAHYENLAAQMLSSVVRHKWLVISLVAVALAAASIAIPVMPRKYSAEALIFPNLFSREGKLIALASVDAAQFINGEARLIGSDTFLRAVAKRLGYDSEGASARSWATQSKEWIRATFLPETQNESPFDRAVAMLRRKVVILNDTRSYIISVSFTAPSAVEAANVVNAFAVEYLREKAIQRGLDRASSAENELRQQLEIYGDKHPKTLKAIAELDAARAALEAVTNAQDGSQEEVSGDASVNLAVPNYTPTSPKGLMILGLSLLSGLVAGICLAIWRDRRDGKRKQPIGPPHLQ